MNNNRSRVAFIGTNGSVTCDYLKIAHKMGLETFCFSNSISNEVLRLTDHFINVSIFDMDIIVERCKKLNVDGIIPTTELTIPVAAYASEKMGLIGNPYPLMINIVNKAWVRENNKILLNPKFKCIKNNKSLNLKEMDLNLPIIVKPIYSGGKNGLTLVNKKENIEEAVNLAIKYDKNNEGILVEEYIEGKEYSVETLSYKGIHTIVQITDKISGGNHCVELGHSQPANLSDDEYNCICTQISSFLSSIGYVNGPSAIEIKINSQGIYLIEINARPNGDKISSILTPLSTGYNYLEAAIKIYLDIEPPKYTKTLNNYCGIRFITNQTREWLSYLDKENAKEWLYQDSTNSEKIKTVFGNKDTVDNFFIYCCREKILDA